VVPHPSQLDQDLVEGAAFDVLHHVVGGAAVLADPEDRDDVGVVKPGRGPGLAPEALQLTVVLRGPGWQHLESHPPAERLLLGLVHDAHAAPTDLADDAVLVEALHRLPGPARQVGGLVRARADILHHHERAEQASHLPRESRMAAGIVADRRPFPAAIPLQELVRQTAQRVGLGSRVGRGWVVHHVNLVPETSPEPQRPSGTLSPCARGVRCLR
jgi:hypothetical protein